MPFLTYIQIYAAFITFKAIVMTIVAFAIDVTFLKSLALVATSAIITGIFGIIVALVQRANDRRLHERMDTIEERQITNTATTTRIADATGAKAAPKTGA